MIANELLKKINISFNGQERQILLRCLLNNKQFLEILSQQEIQNKLFDHKPLLQEFLPVRIGLILVTGNEKLISNNNAKYVNENLEEFSKKGEDVIQRLILQNNFKPGLVDALFLSFFIHDSILRQNRDNTISEILISQRINTDNIDFWGLVFACFINIHNDGWKSIHNMVKVNPFPEYIESIINSLVSNLMGDEEIKSVSQEIIKDQKIMVCNQYLEVLRKKGLNQISQDVANAILPLYQKDDLNSLIINENFPINDWVSIGKAINFIQSLALLKYYSGKVEEANLLYEKSKDLMNRQYDSINQIQKEINQDDRKFAPEEIQFNLNPHKKENENHSQQYLGKYILPIVPYKKIEELIDLGIYSEAEKLILEIKSHGVTDPNIFLLSADVSIRQGGYSQALEELTLVDSVSNLNLEGKKKLCKVNFLLGNYQQAYTDFNSLCIDGDAKNILDIEDLCTYAISVGRPKETLAHTENYLSKYPENENVLVIAAEAAFTQNDFDGSLKYLQKAITIKKDQPKAWILLAKIHDKKGDSPKSFESLLTGLRFNPQSISILFELMKNEFNSGNLALFNKYADETLNAQLESVNLILEIADFLLESSKKEFARNLLLEAIKKWPKNIPLIEALSSVYIIQEKQNQAVKLLEDAEKIFPLDYCGYKLLLLSLFNTSEEIFPIHARLGSHKNNERISNLINKLLTIWPSDPWLKLFNAVYLALNKDYAPAFDILTNFTAHSENPSADIIWRYQLSLGSIFLEIGKPESAIAIFLDIVNKKRDLFEITQFLADAFHACGLDEKAFEIVWDAFNRNSNLDAYSLWLSEFINIISKSDYVINVFSKNNETKKLSNSELLLWAMLEQKQGNCDGVKNIINKIDAIELNLSQSEIYIQLLIYIRAYLAAESKIDQLFLDNVENQRKFNLYRASLYFQQGNLLKSIEYLEKNLDGDNSVVSENLILLSLLANKKSTGDSIKLVEKCLEKISGFDSANIEIIEDTIKNIIPIFPDEWQALLSNQEECIKLVVTAFINIENAEKALNYLNQILSSGNKNESLKIFAAEIARDQLMFDVADQFVGSLSFLGKGIGEIGERSLDLDCLVIEIALEKDDDLKAASLLNKIIKGNENNPRLQAIQSRILLRQGDSENSESFYNKAKNNTQKGKIWLLTAAREIGDHEGFIQLICEGFNKDTVTPALMLEYLKEKAELIKQSELAKELHSKILENKYRDWINTIETKMTFDLDDLEKKYPEIAQWAAINEAFEKCENNFEINYIGHEFSSFISYLYRKQSNIDALRKMLENDESNPEINFYLALALASKDYENSRKHFLAAIAKNSNNAFYFAGLAYLENENDHLEEALNMIEHALEVTPNEIFWRKFAVETAESISNWDKVISHGEIMLANGQNEKVVIKKLIHAYFLKENYISAANLINKFQLKEDESYETFMVMGKIALSNKNYKKVITFSNKAHELNPESARPSILLSEMSLQLDQNDKAYEFAAKAVNIDPLDIQSHLALANAMEKKDGFNAAIQYLQTIIEKGMKSNLINSKIAELIRSANGCEAALNFLKSIDGEPDELILNQMAQYELELGNEIEAETLAKRSLSIIPDQLELAKLMGEIAQKKGNLDQAIKYLSDAISYDPGKVDNYLNACDVYLQRREAIKALEIINQGIKMISDDTRLYQKAGLIYSQMKDYKKAEESFQLAHQLNPEDGKIKRQLDTLSAMNIIYSHQETKV